MTQKNVAFLCTWVQFYCHTCWDDVNLVQSCLCVGHAGQWNAWNRCSPSCWHRQRFVGQTFDLVVCAHLLMVSSNCWCSAKVAVTFLEKTCKQTKDGSFVVQVMWTQMGNFWQQDIIEPLGHQIEGSTMVLVFKKHIRNLFENGEKLISLCCSCQSALCCWFAKIWCQSCLSLHFCLLSKSGRETCSFWISPTGGVLQVASFSVWLKHSRVSFHLLPGEDVLACKSITFFCKFKVSTSFEIC